MGRLPPLPVARRLSGTRAQLTRDYTRPIGSRRPRCRTSSYVYRRDPKNAEMCERLVDLDEGLQEWRYRHVKMVQRTIGSRPGTGGSRGAAYCDHAGAKSFPDLWEIRGGSEAGT